MEFAGKYQYNNAFAISCKQYHVRVCFALPNPCSLIRNVVTVVKMRSDTHILYVLQNVSTRRSTAKEHFPKGNQIIYVLLHRKFSAMDAGINFGDAMLSSLYWNKSSL